ncbi:MAG: ATP-binding protein, partial [Candidatus Dormibacteraeota bacterium]|nr:ATP-binding protein [Candidatus Dormibacteraeota bacterium]
DDFSRASGVVTVAEVAAPAAAALREQSADVVQLVREALSNVRRHSGASTCRVTLRLEPDEAVLEIDDDGEGFDAAVSRPGMGLDNLRRRADGLGGVARIDSIPGEGTVVSIRLPAPSATAAAGGGANA